MRSSCAHYPLNSRICLGGTEGPTVRRAQRSPWSIVCASLGFHGGWRQSARWAWRGSPAVVGMDHPRKAPEPFKCLDRHQSPRRVRRRRPLRRQSLLNSQRTAAGQFRRTATSEASIIRCPVPTVRLHWVRRHQQRRVQRERNLNNSLSRPVVASHLVAISRMVAISRTPTASAKVVSTTQRTR